MATPLSSFYPWVAVVAPNCPLPLVDQALRDAAREFCSETNVSQVSITQDVTAGQASYTTTVDADTRVNTVLACTHKDRPLIPVATADVRLPAALSDGAVTKVTGTPLNYYRREANSASIYLWPIPDTTVASGLYTKVAVTVSPGAATLPDELYQLYAADIASGAAALLLTVPGQPATDTGLAAFYRAQFTRAVDKAKRDARVGYVQSAQRVRMRPFA